ncbi:hypothetical protein J6590_015557 [Homalodisca vitripennis]|nr:hypothetical protein J6590_015557 [Homalodisca vitripennis]
MAGYILQDISRSFNNPIQCCVLKESIECSGSSQKQCHAFGYELFYKDDIDATQVLSGQVEVKGCYIHRNKRKSDGNVSRENFTSHVSPAYLVSHVGPAYLSKTRECQQERCRHPYESGKQSSSCQGQYWLRKMAFPDSYRLAS